MTTYPTPVMATRRAEWIWRQRPPLAARGLAATFGAGRSPVEERNRFVYFRKGFDLTAKADKAMIHISADGRYQLFVNGHFVGRGPARCDPAFQYYDSYDIAPQLQVGRNVIAVLGHSYGQDMAWYQLPRHEPAQWFGCGGIFVQGDLQVNGQVIPINSDDSWRYLESAAWQQDTSAGAVGFVEVYDARQAPLDWQMIEFDDSTWARAAILSESPRPGTTAIRPFPLMVPRDIPHLLERPQRAVSLHRCGQVTEVSDKPNLPQQIGAETLTDLQGCQADGVENLVTGQGQATIRTTSGQAVAIVLDFGGTVTGRPTFDITAPAGAIIDVGYSERLQDDHIEPREHSFLTSENVDRVFTRAGRQQWERFEWTGFRYLQLTIRKAQEDLVIHKVNLNFTSYPVEQRGSFTCSDDLLNKIWQAGANTLQLCMHDGFEDCPQREQRQFVGDAYVEILVNFATFGDTHLAAKFLRQVRQSQRADGMTQTATPSDVAAASKAVIGDYALYWLMAIREYVRYTGDTAIVAELYPGVEGVLGWFARFLDDDHLLNEPPHWIFVDWAEIDKRGQCTALNAQYVHTLRVGAELAEIYGLPNRALTLREQADQTMTAINQHLWDEVRGVYVDCRVDGVQSRRVSQQASGLCLAYGLVPTERLERVISYITDPARVKLTAAMGALYQPPAFDEEQDVVLAQPFCAHHLHRGLVAAEHSDLVLSNIRERWGAMIAAGSTTIWELWSPLASQCHAWSTTPTFDLSTYVLGIAPLADGFTKTLIAPRPCDLKWARGRFPTPHGQIDVGWEWRGEQFILTMKVPETMALKVILPVAAQRIEINGQLILEQEQIRDTSLGWSVQRVADGVQMSCRRGSGYQIIAQ